MTQNTVKRLWWASLLTGFLVQGCASPGRISLDYQPPGYLQSSTLQDQQVVQAPVERELSLESILELALENNRSVSLAELDVLIAQNQRSEALGVLMPKISVDARYQIRNNDEGFGNGEDSIVTGSRELGTAQLSAIVPLYDFGGARAQLRARNRNVDIARSNAQFARQQLVLAVTQAYFRILEAQKIRGVVQESIQAVEEQLRVAQDFFEQGLVSRSDLLVAEVQLANRRQEFIQAENGIRQAQSRLNRLMGQPVDQPVQLEDIQSFSPWTGSLEEQLPIALRQRPDLVVLREQVRVAQAQLKVSRSTFYPRFYGFGEANYTTNDSLLNQGWLSGGVGLQWNLFDFSALSRVSQASHRVEQALARYQDLADDIVLEVQSAHLNLQEASLRVPIAQQAIEQAAENLRMLRDRYREGLLSSSDVLLEEERLAQARSNYFRALYDYHEALALMNYTVGGKPLPDASASLEVHSPMNEESPL